MSNEPLLEHSKITCFIGLGANLGNPIQQINAALAELKFSEKVDLLDSSPLYRSEPMGPQDQDDYINAVAKIETNLSPIGLLDYLQHIESDYGRVRKKEQWSARTLDLDLLLYGNQQIKSDRLTVPHYGIDDRAFVLYPLYDIEKNLIFPNNTSIKSLVQQIKRSKPRIEKLA